MLSNELKQSISVVFSKLKAKILPKEIGALPIEQVLILLY